MKTCSDYVAVGCTKETINTILSCAGRLCATYFHHFNFCNYKLSLLSLSDIFYYYYYYFFFFVKIYHSHFFIFIYLKKERLIKSQRLSNFLV